MQLNEWLYANKITKADFAKKLGISRLYLHHLIAKRQKCSPSLAQKIHELTEGNVAIESIGKQ